MARGSVVGWVLVLVFVAAGQARGQTRLDERARVKVGAGGTTRAVDLRYRLLISAEFTAQGARVLAVNPAGPGAWMRLPDGTRGILEPGDLVTAVDGMPVRGLPNYYSAMNAGGRNKRLTVRDRNTGREAVWDVRAAEVVPPGPDPNPNPRRATGVKILLVADTDDGKIGKFIEVSLGRLREQFEQIPGLPPERVQLRVLTGARVNAKTIMDEVNALRPGPTEAVLYYHLGHGEYDPRKAAGDPSGGHLFSLKDGGLMRKPVWDALRAKGARLTVMISDTCNTAADAADTSARRRSAPITRTGESRVLAGLLLDHVGELNVSGSSKDQFGWFSKSLGGWWSDAVLFALGPPAHPGGFVTWDAFLGTAGDKCSRTYLAAREEILKNPGSLDAETLDSFRNQRDQRPQAFVKSVRAMR
jgi:hypothetical protein